MKKIIIVIGTRPNFIKITQFCRAVKEAGNKFELIIVHTGQHYDDKMSKIFFEQFGIVPDVFLNVEGGSAVFQMANMMIGLEKTFVEHKPDLLIVVGDVNSTVAAALTADRMKIKVAHVESGLRSYDRSMPEEINRIITDEIADYYFVTEQSGIDNLVKEGKPRENIFFVGNTMIDTLMAFKGKIDSSDILRTLGLKSKDFVLITMHRPAVVDSEEGLIKLIELINEVTKKYKVVFPLHPRTIKTIAQFNLKGKISENKNLIITEPLDYFSFQKLIKDCKFIITDSGGIQEESTFLGIPCLTLRPNTERPSTISIGTNELVPFNISELKRKIAEIETGQYKKGRIPPLWDGKATERIIDTLIRLIH